MAITYFVLCIFFSKIFYIIYLKLLGDLGHMRFDVGKF